ncbi:MAG: Prolyl-tRNA synthetase, bacterial type [uncultured Rubrobacteraceae bacterium]|uniref:Proline--tRNA ligase n=1 Tax=uncultured Rubrobacteraceae bacterium TaxID=349277 RepID=A0A6J4RB46_9ACTN|nr:MAG: Prolyl-tRNA synthetase, bacterial type [uncultured Rubrobacteraceae bacterium]
MRMGELFGRTLREVPSGTEVAGHGLLLRAGFVRPLAAGIFSYLPLARRSLDKVSNILREEMGACGGQEVSMPVVHPAEAWERSGRYGAVGSELVRLRDRRGRAMVLAMTHEEVVAGLVAGEVDSYQQLPRLVYQLQTKFRDDARPRAGLIRAREFTMKDAYSLDKDEKGLDLQYRTLHRAYYRIFGRCGLPTVAVGADVGIMGGSLAHEFMYLSPVGEDTILVCDGCGYTANRQVARFRKPAADPEEQRPTEKVATPGTDTIEDLTRLLRIPRSRTAKAVFLVATLGEEERFVFAVVRGDTDLNETKLANAVGAGALRPAREEEIRAAGAEPGYGSPVGLEGVLVVADDAVAFSPNLVAGANEEGYHLLNVNHGRDFVADVVADVAAAERGSACPQCGAPMRAERGVEVGNIFKLGTRYAEAFGAYFLDRDGERRPVVMGSYGIGVGRLLACIAEEHRDEDGLAWPISVAPYHVHLVASDDGAAPELYKELRSAGVEVLYDDRPERLGTKFKDADLIGAPIRLTLTPRSLRNGGVEIKLRRDTDSRIVPTGEAVAAVRQKISELEAELAETGPAR